MTSLDDLLIATAQETVNTPDDTSPPRVQFSTPNGEVEVDVTELNATIAGFNSSFASPEFLAALRVVSELATVFSATYRAWDGVLPENMTRWLAGVGELLDSVAADSSALVSVVVDDLIPSLAAINGTLDQLVAPSAPPSTPGNAAANRLDDVTRGNGGTQKLPPAGAGVPSVSVDKAYEVIAGIPSVVAPLGSVDYTAPVGEGPSAGSWSTHISSGGSAPGVGVSPSVQAPGAPVPAVSGSGAGVVPGGVPAAPAAGVRGGSGPVRGFGSGGGGSMSPAMAALDKANRLMASTQRDIDKITRAHRSGRLGRAGGGGVSKAELQQMIAAAKKRIAAERKAKGPSGSRRRLQVPAGRSVTSSYLDKSSAAKPPKATFLDIATTTPGVARPDSETSSSKVSPAAAGGSGGSGGGGMRGGMMPMGGMMGGMMRGGQGGPGGGGSGGPGSGGGGAVEVPRDYDLNEVGAGAVGSVAGGVIRGGVVGDPEDDSADIVSPVRPAGESEPESSEGAGKSGKRGLGNIFG